jgi:hypothetical protein
MSKQRSVIAATTRRRWFSRRGRPTSFAFCACRAVGAFAGVPLGLLHPGGNRLRGRLELARKLLRRAPHQIDRLSAGTPADRRIGNAASDTSVSEIEGVHETGSTPFCGETSVLLVSVPTTVPATPVAITLVLMPAVPPLLPPAPMVRVHVVPPLWTVHVHVVPMWVPASTPFIADNLCDRWRRQQSERARCQ